MSTIMLVVILAVCAIVISDSLSTVIKKMRNNEKCFMNIAFAVFTIGMTLYIILKMATI